VIVGSLLAALWCLVATVRDRPVDRSHLVALGVVQALVLAQIVVAVVHLAQGQRPHSMTTFIGYLVAIFLIVPAGTVLARMEPTRWGSLIATVACVVDAVLIVRLDQVWG
jgi:hypothetical protein